MSVDREKLYDEVWAEPMTTVAKRYEVSSSFLARVCARLNVPRPPRGYWAQRAVGIKLPRALLPKPAPGGELEWVRDGAEPRRQPLSATSSRARRAKQERPATHPLLIGARQSFERARESRGNEYVRPYKKNLVDIFVSKEMLDPAIQAANALFLALEDRGMNVILAPRGHQHLAAHLRMGEAPDPRRDYYYHHSTGRWQPASPTIVVIGDVTVGLTLFEVSEEVEADYDSKLHKYVRTEPAKTSPARRVAQLLNRTHPGLSSKHWLPSGRLGLHAWATKHGVDWAQHWYESTTGTFVARVPAIVKELRAASSKITELSAIAEVKRQEEQRKWEAQQEKWRKEEAERQRQQAEHRRQEALARREKEFGELIGRWRLARDIREYVDATHALLAAEQMRAAEALETQLTWALAYAERLDPLTSLRESIANLKRDQSEHSTGADGNEP